MRRQVTWPPGSGLGAAAVGAAHLPQAPPDEHRAALFAAVMKRLLDSVAPAAFDAARVRLVVGECVEALRQMQAESSGGRGWRARLERELSLAHAALASKRADMADMRARELLARHLATHDGLTSLPNRDSFYARLKDALQGGAGAAPALSVFFIDLDAFKAVNDGHGHGAGDVLLRIVAERLRGAARPSDLVCRLGGDEFACLLPGALDHEELGQVAARLHAAVTAPMRCNTVELSVHPSIGIAVCPADGVDPEALLLRADAAMYRAKRERTGWAFAEVR